MNELDNTAFLELLPDSLKSDPDAIAAARSLSQSKLFKEDMAKLLVLFDPETLKNRSDYLIDYLFQQEHVDVMGMDLTKEQKAELIFNSPSIHIKKGTAWAVQEVVSSVIAKAKVVEWFEYGGDPYMFQIEIEKFNSTFVDLGRLSQVIDTAKNLRSSLETFIFILLKPKVTASFRTYIIEKQYIRAGEVNAGEVFL